jgi:hypothetical protein
VECGQEFCGEICCREGLKTRVRSSQPFHQYTVYGRRTPYC